MKPEELTYWKGLIDRMSHTRMAEIWRFSPAESEFFQNQELSEHFKERFKSLGGMTMEMSKKLGWSR